MVKVNVKFGKDSHDVENSDPSFSTFQALLFSLTNVPPERQKIMLKGKMLKDDAAVAGLKDGDKLVLMGSADVLPAAPQKKIVFEEDLTDAQKIGVVKDLLSAGLHNLGNTCYMASTLQCMRAVPELKQALISKSRSGTPVTHDPQAAVVRQLGSLYNEMDQSVAPITPMMFTTVFRSTFPQFAETSNEGHWMQQDADEALQSLMNAMANTLKKDGAVAANASNDNVIDEYFGGEMETITKPKAFDASAAAGSSTAAAASASASSAAAASGDVKVEREHYRRLRCFIALEINFLYQGLKAGLTEERELRGQIYERTSTLLTLPRYLIVQMNRFFWKQDVKKKSKILRKVDAPFKLDMIEFAHPTLKAQLSAARNFAAEEQAEKLGLNPLGKKAKTADGQTAGSAPATTAAAGETSAAMDVDGSSNPWAAGAAGSSDAAVLTTPTCGNFELFAMVTHKGRNVDSGHYVSWVKRSEPSGSAPAAGEAKWLKFDDDKVSEVKEDDIKALHGGGDMDMSYLHFYRRIDDAVKYKGRVLPEVMPAVAPSDKKKKDAPAPAPAAAAASK